MPALDAGELIAIPAGGAYQLSMSSNYNGARRPAVLWLDDGTARLIQERETPADLLRRDRPLTPLPSAANRPVKFTKYQALGNDYLVLDPDELVHELAPAQIQLICDRHYGVGSDGILLGPLPHPEANFGLRLFNPDGGEFEKSGNGLRIFARYLWDRNAVGEGPFTVGTPGGLVTCQMHPYGERVTVEMGVVSFSSTQIPVAGPPREVLDEPIEVEGQAFRYSAATIGNPHCVLLCDEVSPQDAKRWGPLIENDPRFPNRTNVQFVRVMDRSTIQIEIWERGVGYTLASGSSSCAAAAVVHRLGLVDAQVLVQCPGGDIEVSLSDAMVATMTGPVAPVCEGTLLLPCIFPS